MNLRIVTPEPRRQNRYGRHICPTRVRFDTDRWPTYECGRKFWLRSSYDAHWIQEHRLKPMPTVAPGPAPGSLSLEEQGRRLASRRDDLIALGVPPELLAVPVAPPSGHDLIALGAPPELLKTHIAREHYISRVHHCQHPDCIAKNQTHIAREDTP